jgi:indolepyruvate ferredoxin oxidoreductase
MAALHAAAGPARIATIDATRLAGLLAGQAITANLFLLGIAWQRGLVPVSREALARAIELNGVAIADNTLAFEWGRRYAVDPGGVETAARPRERLPETRRLSRTLDETVGRRHDYLVGYQDERLARRYADLVARVRAAETRVAPGSTDLANRVAHAWFRLLACKDEYEVARLYCDPQFAAALHENFEGDWRVHLHLAIPGIARVDPVTGEPHKRAYGPNMLRALRLLAGMKRLRGTLLDPFRHGAERVLDRALIAEYEATIEAILAGLRADNLAAAIEIAALPDGIRGFGPVRARSAETARACRDELLARFGHAPLTHAA